MSQEVHIWRKNISGKSKWLSVSKQASNHSEEFTSRFTGLLLCFGCGLAQVLMCSRSEKVRPRLLALRVVKLLAEQLKEEFLVLLPETLPFLAELLEDADLNVVANTQGVIKNLEDLSGENLAQYF
jgi:hypothetical protein